MLSITAADRDAFEQECHPDSCAQSDVEEAVALPARANAVLRQRGTHRVVIDRDRYCELLRQPLLETDTCEPRDGVRILDYSVRVDGAAGTDSDGNGPQPGRNVLDVVSQEVDSRRVREALRSIDRLPGQDVPLRGHDEDPSPGPTYISSDNDFWQSGVGQSSVGLDGHVFRRRS